MDRQTGMKRGRFMNRQPGSDLAPGTGRDMLTAEGGVVSDFFGGRSCGMLGEASRGGGWMDGWMDAWIDEREVETVLYSPDSHHPFYLLWQMFWFHLM